jgi:methionyl-tRNA formyltransferase
VSWRVVIVTRIFPVALGFHAAVREAGHEPVALLTLRGNEHLPIDELPPELDVLIPAQRSSIAPLLESVRPDLVVCMGFPWKVPPDALAVPTFGWLNGHPSLLPLHRGPIPVAWAIRNGDPELGISFHFMDAELDTGPVVAQRRLEIGAYAEPEEFYGRMGQVVTETLTEALHRIADGDRGTAQEGEGEYESFFGEDAVWLDRSRTALELHRLAWAWRFAIPSGTERGLLVDLDGEVVRVLQTSLDDVEGATRIDCADGPLFVVKTEPAAVPLRAPSRR